MRSVAIVAGALANRAGNGGGAWVRLSWVRGLRRLGFDTHFIEQIDPCFCVDTAGAPCGLQDSVNLRWFRSVTNAYLPPGHATLQCGRESYGLSADDLPDLLASAELLVNLSGHLDCAPLLSACRRAVYIDLDPGFTQIWNHSSLVAFSVRSHHYYFTIGENIGRQCCCIPAGDIPWRATRQPVVLEDWPVVPASDPGRLTTVSSWRGPFGPVEYGGRKLGLKVHEYRRFIGLPARVPQQLEIALRIDAADAADRERMVENGWRLVNPDDVAGDPQRFREYVAASGGEFSVASGVYVETNSGWISDRTVRYLATGRPALVQDTGIARKYSDGWGLVPFSTEDEATAAARSIDRDYAHHSGMARRIAEEYFDSDRVIGQLLEQVGGSP